MSKRKASNNEGSISQKVPKKYSLDSDEEDNVDENVLDDDDIEGEEEGNSGNIGQERFTAFNMREELEDGHFDRDGHFIWKNEKEVRDNWLDNIDWQKIKPDNTDSKVLKNLGEESDDSDVEVFHETQEIELYKKILSYMEPKETIAKSLMRLGRKNKNLSSIERLKRKKAGLLDSNNEVTELTELADKVLSKTGNMDIYQETYEQISKKIQSSESNTSLTKETSLDMYSDDFNSMEEDKLKHAAGTSVSKEKGINSASNIKWEFKWDLKEEKIDGPYNTEQMLKWSKEGYFKKGVWARKHGDNSSFCSTNRIDFELYI